MVKKLLAGVVLLAAITGTGLFVWKHFFTGEEAVIIKRCRKLGEAASFSSDDGLAAVAIRSETLKSLLADTCSLELRTYEVKEQLSREEVVSRHFALKHYWSSLSIDVDDVSVLALGETEAAVTFTARATAIEKSGGRNVQTIPVWASLKKIDGAWRFADFREENVLEK